jgi:hypothetical protein
MHSPIALPPPREAAQSFSGSFFSKKELLSSLHKFVIFTRENSGAVEQDQWTA